MRRTSPLLIAAAAACLGLAPPARRPIELEEIVAFRTIPELSLSPDGARVAFTVRWGDLSANRFETDLWVAPVARAGAARRLTFSPGGDSAPKWSPDGRRIAFLSERTGPRQVWAIPADGGEPVQLTALPESISGFDWAPDGRCLLLVAPAPVDEDQAARQRSGDDALLMGRHWRNDRLWLVSIAGAPERSAAALTDGARHVDAGAAWSPDGAAIAFVSTPDPEADSDEEALLQVLDVAGRTVSDVPGGGRASSFAWAPRGRTLAFTRAHEDQGISREDLFVWSPGAAARNVSAGLDRDVEGWCWSAGGRSLLLLREQGASTAVALIELPSGRPTVSPAAGHTLRLPACAGGDLVHVRSDRPEEIWRTEAFGSGRQLTDINGWTAALELPQTSTIRWRGPAGEIEGILTMPPGPDAGRRRPLIVRPHGGPRSRATLEIDPLTAWLASRGYMVLKPNFRGSTGYGDAFTRANVGDWGEGPFRDLMAGVDHLVADGMADPGRVFLYGWSYGGYLTNWAITHTDRFKAAASGAGVADLRMQYAISDARRWRFDYFFGSPFRSYQPTYEEQSPITYARDARTPTLFLHGERDERCPLPQGLMMYRALRDNGVAAELVVYPREGHDFSEPRHILDRARRIEEWFRRHDPAGR